MKFHVIDINKFDDTEYAYGEQVNQKTGDFERCNTCGSAISMRKWLPPLEITLSKDEVGDFIFGSFRF